MHLLRQLLNLLFQCRDLCAQVIDCLIVKHPIGIEGGHETALGRAISLAPGAYLACDGIGHRDGGLNVPFVTIAGIMLVMKRGSCTEDGTGIHSITPPD